MTQEELNTRELVGKRVHFSALAFYETDPVLDKPALNGCAYACVKGGDYEKIRTMMDSVYQVTKVEPDFEGHMKEAHPSEQFWLFAKKLSGTGPEVVNGGAYEFIILPD